MKVRSMIEFRVITLVTSCHSKRYLNKSGSHVIWRKLLGIEVLVLGIRVDLFVQVVYQW